MSRAARHRRDSRRPWLVSLTSGVVVGVLVGSASVVIGLAGPVSSATADTSSTVTVHANQQDTDLGNAPMPDLAVTVSQTRDLQSQGIQISWTGGKQSGVQSSATGGTNFLQVMQCWDTDASGGPDRTSCQYGGLNTPGATRDSLVSNDAPVAPEDEQFTVKGSGFGTPTYTGITFRAADKGKVEKVKYDKFTKTTSFADADPEAPRIDLNSNQYFTKYTTNEINWAGSGATGEGSVKFEVQTVAQSPGLGCGKPKTVNGGFVGSPCWLVILPRGEADPNEENIINSGLFWDTWKHRIAVKLDFLPVGVGCAIGSAERQLSGSELSSVAIASWQPSLCGAENGAAYTTITGAESDAVLAANSTTAQPMALTSNALSSPGVTDKLRYAPIALTGISVAFSIDREVNAIEDDVPDDVKGRARLPFESLNLTPRLIAKLLTSSYIDSLPSGAPRDHVGYVDPAHAGPNARNLTTDPDFLAINDPEWAYQSLVAASLSDLIVPQGRSDTATAVWKYVLSDADAVDFLNGIPDPWGMKVNPWSSINPDVYGSVSGGLGSPVALPRSDFPKADPSERPAGPTGLDAVNVVTWRPYTNDLSTNAYLVLRGDGQELGEWDPNSVPPKYGKVVRKLPGFQRVLGLTDTGAAAKYQVVSAKLRNPAGEFVAPTVDSLEAAAAAMTADPAQPQVYRFDPTSENAKGAPTAYPLAMPVYAAVNPAMNDTELRNDYANFINYAATVGQQPGTAVGMLPEGYAPIPQGWQEQALVAAADIAAGPQKPISTPVPKPQSSSAPSVAAPPPAAAAPPPVSPPVDPNATGKPAGSLVGKATPADAEIGAISSAVPLAIAAGLVAALLVPLLTRIRRRS